MAVLRSGIMPANHTAVRVLGIAFKPADGEQREILDVRSEAGELRVKVREDADHVGWYALEKGDELIDTRTAIKTSAMYLFSWIKLRRLHKRLNVHATLTWEGSEFRVLNIHRDTYGDVLVDTLPPDSDTVFTYSMAPGCVIRVGDPIAANEVVAVESPSIITRLVSRLVGA